MPHHDGSTTYAKDACCDTSQGWPASRRSFLQGGATLAAAGAVTPLLPATSIAQTADPELARLAIYWLLSEGPVPRASKFLAL